MAFIFLGTSVGVVTHEGVLDTGLGDGTVAVLQAHVVALVEQTVSSLQSQVLSREEGSETPLLGNDNVLGTGELVRRTTQGLDELGLEGILTADGVDNLTNVQTSDNTEGLAKSMTHTTGQPIGTSTTKHFVLTDDVEGVHTNAHVERVFAGCLEHVLVHNNTACLEALRAELLLLTAHQVNTKRELVSAGRPSANVEDGDLGVRYTAKVPRLDVRLVLTVAIASGRTTSHCLK